MEKKAKISTGPNARPRNESIAQTAEGIPDDAERRNKPTVRDGRPATDKGKASGKSQNGEYKGRELPGAAGFRSAGAEEDTYD